MDGVTILPALVDAHVHLGIVPPDAIRAGGIGRVVDLGWDPAAAAGWAAGADPDLVVAGGLLGAPGGYPSRAGWAPAAAAVPVPDAAAARDAVTRMAELGARVVKATLNSDVGPVLDEAVLGAVVDAAHRRGLAVAVHAQGAGMVERAVAAGVDVLAHTPWTEDLDDALLDRLAARTTWISTLDIHGHGRGGPAFATAQRNLRRFVGRGGDVRYGTDLGNGPLPVGVNEREIVALAGAGLDRAAIVRAMTVGTVGRWDPFPGPSAVATRVVGAMPPEKAGPEAFAAWLGTATVHPNGGAR